MPFSISVPTSTIIAATAHDPHKVWVIEQAKKHRKRMTLVGGRVELPRQTHLQCAFEEWGQEAGGKGATLIDLQLFATKTDPYSDVRPSTLGKLTHETCAPELRDVEVTGHYGAPDEIYWGRVDGEASPKDGEAKQCLLIDVRDIRCTETEEESRFGAQHDLILIVYRLFLYGRSVDKEDFSNFSALRARLLAAKL